MFGPWAPGLRGWVSSPATSTTVLPLLQEPLLLSCSVHNSVSAAAGATGHSCDAPRRCWALFLLLREPKRLL